MASWIGRLVEIRWRSNDSPPRRATLAAIDLDLKWILLQPEDGSEMYWASLEDVHGIVEVRQPESAPDRADDQPAVQWLPATGIHIQRPTPDAPKVEIQPFKMPPNPGPSEGICESLDAIDQLIEEAEREDSEGRKESTHQ
jgi:hypothetical protein